MSLENDHLKLPSYQSFIESIEVLHLPYSASELHGMMCGYLCAGAADEGESYINALIGSHKGDIFRDAALALFRVYSVSQQQIKNMDFEFQLLLPGDHALLNDRAQAFSEWCDGFTQGLAFSGIEPDRLHEEEAQDVLQHMAEFAELDYDALDVNEEDEKALMEVSEYARMAVLRLHGDLMSEDQTGSESQKAH